MESVDLDMGEIFEEEELDDMQTQGPLPDLPDENQDREDDDERENVEVLSRLKDLSKGARKKSVQRPQPKLDPSRLTGARGIPILPKLFEKIKFKGKGHEAHDLSMTMRQLEHWAHRLFPKMPFDEVLERAEKLGNKKEVQTCIKKIRMDMPVLDEDFKDDEDILRGSDDEGQANQQAIDRDEEEVLDEIFRDVSAGTSQSDQPSHDASILSQTSSSSQVNATPKTPLTSAQKDSTAPGLTPEQLQRMEKNKQMARDKRLARLGLASPAPQKTPTPRNTAATPGSSTVATGQADSSSSNSNGASAGLSNSGITAATTVASTISETVPSQDSVTGVARDTSDDAGDQDMDQEISVTGETVLQETDKNSGVQTDASVNPVVENGVDSQADSAGDVKQSGDGASLTSVRLGVNEQETVTCTGDMEETENQNMTPDSQTGKQSSKAIPSDIQEPKAVLREVQDNSCRAVSPGTDKISPMATEAEELTEDQLLETLDV